MPKITYQIIGRPRIVKFPKFSILNIPITKD